MTKYKFNFQKKFLIPLWIIVAICIIGIIFDCVFLGLAIKNNLPFAFHTASLIMLLIVGLITLIIIFGTNYLLKEKYLICNFALKKTKIAYSDIQLIRHDKETNQTIIYYNVYKKSGEQEINYKLLFIKNNELEKFITDLKAKNNMIIYEIFNNEEENEKL